MKKKLALSLCLAVATCQIPLRSASAAPPSYLRCGNELIGVNWDRHAKPSRYHYWLILNGDPNTEDTKNIRSLPDRLFPADNFDNLYYRGRKCRETSKQEINGANIARKKAIFEALKKQFPVEPPKDWGEGVGEQEIYGDYIDVTDNEVDFYTPKGHMTCRYRMNPEIKFSNCRRVLTQASPQLPDKMLGYWCFTRAHWYPDEKIEPDTTPLVRSNAFNCANLGGVRFWRRGNKSAFQLGRFEWRADCKISKIERIENKYRVSADCTADRDIFYTGEDSQKPQHETRIFEIWRAKPGLRWRENEYDQTELSCARVSDKLPVEPDGSYLNLRAGPGTEFKVKVKLPAGTDLSLDAVS